MRLILPVLSLLYAAFSLSTDFLGFSPDSRLCALGWCRIDQVAASIDAQGLNTENIRVVLAQNPANPLLWATYGELLNLQGNVPGAVQAFEHAVERGPHMAAVLMRTANFDFTHGRIDHGRLMARQIFEETDGFDQVLFSYLTSTGLPMSQVLDLALPPQKRSASAWLTWLGAHGNLQDLKTTWDWMTRNQLTDEKSLLIFVRALADHKAYLEAQKAWAGWFGTGAGNYLRPERVWNPRFELESKQSPFDWVMDSSSSAKMVRRDGLEIQFAGTDNLSFAHLRQLVPLPPGRYRFSAELQATGLTTDQLPQLHISSPSQPGALHQVLPIANTSGRSKLQADFTVPAGTQTIQIQLERHPSERFDNKIRGTLHLYQLSIMPF